MLRDVRDGAAELVLRYPFTLGGCLFGLALLLALRPGLLATAGSAPQAAVAAPHVAPSGPALPAMLWEHRHLSGAQLLAIPGAFPAREHGAGETAIHGLPATAALTEWSATLSLVAALTERPSQAAHDFAGGRQARAARQGRADIEMSLALSPRLH